MKFRIDEDLDVYETFCRNGLGDGDHPLAGYVMERVKSTLDSLGYEWREAWTIHNDGYITEVRKKGDSEYIDLDAAALQVGIDVDDDPRQALLALGLSDIVVALDALNQETVERLLE